MITAEYALKVAFVTLCTAVMTTLLLLIAWGKTNFAVIEGWYM
ncbi:hypothetical protein [Niveispirillum sp. SYP-B3756]|nr:hypothetical protein [Niveispirillum sp. SYP-B3756]